MFPDLDLMAGFLELHMKDGWVSEHRARTGKGIVLARQAGSVGSKLSAKLQISMWEA